MTLLNIIINITTSDMMISLINNPHNNGIINSSTHTRGILDIQMMMRRIQLGDNRHWRCHQLNSFEYELINNIMALASTLMMN